MNRFAILFQFPDRCIISAVMVLMTITPADAGIHVRGENLAPVVSPADFAKQLRHLRGYGPPDVTMKGVPTPHRTQFLEKVRLLRANPQLTPDEQADLGGYLLYLKQVNPRIPAFEEAVQVLEPAARANPRHFALAANLGTAYQLTGKLDAAERLLQSAVDLAPEDKREMEELHLRLVQRRLRENLPRGAQPDLDLLFGRAAAPFRFVDQSGQWHYGKLAPVEVQKLPQQSPQTATKQIEQLLVWLPDDGRLHWQLAEWFMVIQQQPFALELYKDSVDTFRLSHPQLKQRRALVQEAMYWKSLKDRWGTSKPPEAWLAQSLGQSIAAAINSNSEPLQLMNIASALPPRKQASDLFAGGDNIGDVPEKPAKPFEIQPWHWALIALGVILAIAMLYWQFSEWYRTLSKPRRT
ncbi:MAG: tetratricopeptide repeat protein [Planctomycetia bacterium]|nr:tetratricopeptide repeat protein [Planctomycetia bacterium]